MLLAIIGVYFLNATDLRMLPYIIIVCVLTMLVSLSGVIFLQRFKIIYRSLDLFVSLAVGTFLATVFIGLMPEASEMLGSVSAGTYLLIGFLFFVLLSHFISIYHHHHAFDQKDCPECKYSSSASLVLVGDAVHNLVDGIVLAIAFVSSTEVGIAVALGILLHELPQEMAEYFVLIRGGYSRTKALIFNFIVSSPILIGALITYYFATNISWVVGPLLALAAGNLLYIAASDLLPELFSEHSGEKSTSQFLRQFVMMTIGILTISYTLVNFHTHGPDADHDDREHIEESI